MTTGSTVGRRSGAAGRLALLTLAAVALTAALTAVGSRDRTAAAEPALERGTLSSGGLERSYALYRPARLAPRPALLVVLHGSGGSPERIRAFTGRRFEALADEHGFAVAYPQGFEGNWNGCRRRAPFSANLRDVDDVGFVRTLAAHLRRTAPPVGAGGVFVLGFSGGGHLALRLALEAPEVVRGAVVVGANLPAEGASDCAVPRHLSTPVLLINGTADPINPYRGGDVLLPPELGGHDLGPVLSAEETARRLATLADHRSPPRIERSSSADAGVTYRSWSGPGAPDVALVTVHGGGHTIPQPGVTFPAVAGPHSGAFDAPAAAWLFFGRRSPCGRAAGLRHLLGVHLALEDEDVGTLSRRRRAAGGSG